MAEKAFKRKARIKTSPGIIAPGPAAGVHVSQNSTTTGQRELGAPYRAGPAFDLGSHGIAEPEDNALNNDTRQGKQSGNYQQADWLLQKTDSGIVIPLQQRQRLQRQFGRDFSGVRLHIGPAAEQATRSMSAMAFAHGDHIWLGNRANPSDDRVLSHELTHVVQQGHARPLAHRTAIGLPGRAANSPVYGVAPAALGPQGTHAPANRGGAVQRFSLWNAARSAGSFIASNVRTAAGTVTEFLSDPLGATRSLVMRLVHQVAPDFARLIERDGILGFLRNLIRQGLRSLFNGLMAPMRSVFNFGNIGSRFSQALGWISTIAGQLANNDCSSVLAGARQIKAFFSETFGPYVDKIKSIAKKVKDFVSGIWEAISGPVMDILRRIGGALWQSLQAFVRDVRRVFGVVRNALGGAWQRVKTWFNIGAEDGDSEGGGLWNWITDKASSISESIANAVRPIAGPLRNVGGVLLLLVPGGQIVGIMLLWPRLKQAYEWLSQKWQDLNLIPRARDFLTNTVIPMLMDAAEAVGQAMIRGADWLLGLLDRVGGFLASALRASTGWFSPLARIIDYARNQFHRLVTRARQGLRFVSRNLRSLLRRLIEFMQMVMDALIQVAMVIVNPFGIVGFLAGTLWRLIPDCLKGPLIDFILDIIIGFLRLMPPLPQMGLLWPLIKQAMLGFLERVRSFEMLRKVKVSNKLARIVAGMSPGFILGYFRGMLLGLWEGITAPFMAIVAIFELPSQIQEFLNSLGVRLCELIEQIRCFAADLAGRVFGSLDDILNAVGELLSDPQRLIALIQCAIEGAMSGLRSIGASIADQLMRLFEGPDSAMGEMLGRLVGNSLVQLVITYFTAGAGSGVSVINSLSGALRMVGRALRTVVRTIGRLLRQLMSFVRRFGQRIAQGARGVMRRMGGFFRRVANWFRRLFRRIARRFRGRSPASRAKRRQWRQFNREAGRLRSRYGEQGVAKRALKSAYRQIARNHRIGVLFTFITKHRRHWRLWAAPRFFPFTPRRVGRVLLDRMTRWRAGSREVRRRMRRVRDNQRNVRALNGILRPIKRRWGFTVLEARPDRTEHDFNIMGGMSPDDQITEVGEESFATEQNPLPLRYPKRASSQYEKLYLGPRLGSRNRTVIAQSELRAARSSDTAKREIADKISPSARQRWETRGMSVEEFRPHSKKTLPEHSRVIGLDSHWRVGRRKLLKLRPPGRGTPGGGKMNRALKPYGFFPSSEGMDGDHVVEIQLGGRDEIPNLWPLDASENRSAGSLLASMTFNKPDGTSINMNELKQEAGVRRGRGSHVWLRISTTRNR